MISHHALARLWGSNVLNRENLDLVSLRLSLGFKTLDDKSQQIVSALLDNRSGLEKELHDQTMAIAQMLSHAEIAIIDQHDKTRAIVVDSIREATGLIPKTTSEYDEQIGNKRTEERYLRMKVEDHLLRSLSFPTMADRIEEVAEAHAQTFQWLFEDGPEVTSPRNWSNFAEWLRHGNGIYWVNGKAASGKSTLMRYILRHPKTVELLTSWAYPLPVRRANFFFWNSGTIEQRSQVGFLRSLLYEVLHQRRELIPVVLPWQWAIQYSVLLNHSGDGGETHMWTIKRLIQAVKLLAREDIVPIKLFLLVDGLDEYDGDPEELANMFRNLTSSSNTNVKVCLSSRPLMVFKDAFSSSPRLQLQDLTSQDIKLYVNDKLSNNPRYEVLAQREPNRAPALVNDIVTRAEGVFLWVTLVVKSLLDGMGNRDGITDLQRRLSLLPSDLEDLYAHMLKNIDDFYKARASEIFQLVRARREMDETIGPSIHSQEPLTILALAMADPDALEILNSASFNRSDDEVDRLCTEMEDRLSVRCAGLLEVHSPQLTWQAKVQYLHRTARDYIESVEVWGTIINQTTGTPFHPNVSLLRSGVLQLKLLSMYGTTGEFKHLLDVASRTLVCAHSVEIKTGKHNADLLEELDKTMTAYARHNWFDPGIPRLDVSNHHNSFLSFAIQHDLKAYVEKKLGEGDKILRRKPGRPLLDYAINPLPLDQHGPISAGLVEVLLQHGADPNAKFESRSIWEDSLHWQVCFNKERWNNPEKTEQDTEIMRNRAAVIRLMLQYGADRKPRGFGPIGRHSIVSLAIMFMTRSPDEAMEIRRLLATSSPIKPKPKPKPVLKSKASEPKRALSLTSFFKSKSPQKGYAT
jgi:hypothetical protein